MIEEAGELTIIDYKTDRVRGEETAERAQTYSKQLEAYAYAAQRMTGKPVRECVLYFFIFRRNRKKFLQIAKCCATITLASCNHAFACSR